MSTATFESRRRGIDAVQRGMDTVFDTAVKSGNWGRASLSLSRVSPLSGIAKRPLELDVLASGPHDDARLEDE